MSFKVRKLAEEKPPGPDVEFWVSVAESGELDLRARTVDTGEEAVLCSVYPSGHVLLYGICDQPLADALGVVFGTKLSVT